MISKMEDYQGLLKTCTLYAVYGSLVLTLSYTLSYTLSLVVFECRLCQLCKSNIRSITLSVHMTQVNTAKNFCLQIISLANIQYN